MASHVLAIRVASQLITMKTYRPLHSGSKALTRGVYCSGGNLDATGMIAVNLIA